MKDVNLKALNNAAPRLRSIINTVHDAADDACETGDFDLSEKLRTMEGHLTLAYAIGRGLKDGDGEIIVQGGGK